jgi:hypothetical protein
MCRHFTYLILITSKPINILFEEYSILSILLSFPILRSDSSPQYLILRNLNLYSPLDSDR